MIATLIAEMRERTIVLLVERKQIVITAAAVAAALVVAGLGWAAFDWLMAPSTPEIVKASPEEIGAFMADARGMLKMPRRKRMQFFHQLMRTYRSPARREALARVLQEMSPSERATVREAMMQTFKDQFIEDAVAWRRAKDKKERDRIIDRNLARYGGIRQWLVGGPGMPDLTEGMDAGLPTKPEGWSKYIVTHSTPVQRHVARPYAEAAKRPRR